MGLEQIEILLLSYLDHRQEEKFVGCLGFMAYQPLQVI